MRGTADTKAAGPSQDLLTHFVASLMIGNCVAGVWLAAGVAFAATLNGIAQRYEMEAR